MPVVGGGDNATSTATATGGGSTDTATSTGGAGSGSAEPTASNTAQATATSNSSANLRPAKGKVTYTSNDTAADGTVSSGTFTVYTDPPNVRRDSTYSDGTSVVVIETADATYYCTGSSSTDQGCYFQAYRADLSYFLSFRDWFVQAQAEGISLTKSSIAGTNAFCFSAPENANGEYGTICVSDDGLLVSTDGTIPAGGKMNWLATSYSTDVSGSDFEPPYPVYTTPAIPTGY